MSFQAQPKRPSSTCCIEARCAPDAQRVRSPRFAATSPGSSSCTRSSTGAKREGSSAAIGTATAWNGDSPRRGALG